MSEASKPIDIKDFTEAIKDAPDAQILSIKDQLLNSIQKLAETNSVFDQEISKIKVKLAELPEDASHDELRDDYLLFDDSRSENSTVIKKQVQRVQACLDELLTRGLIDKAQLQSESDRLVTTAGVLTVKSNGQIISNEINEEPVSVNSTENPNLQLRTEEEDGIYL